MPLISAAATPGDLLGLVAASPGWRVDAYAPRGSEPGVPTPSHVVAWALVADELVPGGNTVEPVFYAADRTWTPDQFRAAYGETLELKVVPAR